MSEDGWRGGDRPTVGVWSSSDVHPPLSAREVRRLKSTVADAGGDLCRLDEETSHGECIDSADLVVAIGDAALSAILTSEPDVPILPVDVDAAIDPVERDRLPEALAAVLAGEGTVRYHPVLTVCVGGYPPERGLFDATLTAAEPAHISEYAVNSRGERVARFRADGVVVATPLGTRGYAGSVSAPEVSPAIDAVAVAPIAPFVMHANHWVLPDDDLSITVERDEVPISVSVDGRTLATIGTETEVMIGVETSIRTVSVPTFRDAVDE